MARLKGRAATRTRKQKKRGKSFMSSEYPNGFFIFDKSWFVENEFFRSLSHAQFKIMLYLLTSIIRLSKRTLEYKRGDLVAKLYKENFLLVVNVSTPTIAKRCGVSTATVWKALGKFHETGSAIKISNGGKKGENNLYVLGFHDPTAANGERYFVNSIQLKEDGKMPEELIQEILLYHGQHVFQAGTLTWKRLFGEQRVLDY
jgi:biotin operon repressor